MQKKFVTNLIILLFLNLLIKPFWILVIEPYVQDQVGNEAYGEYYALFNFSFLLNILLDFGITNFNNKNIAQNSHLLTKHFSSLFVLKLALAMLYIVATIIVGFFIGYDVRLTKLLIVLGFNQFLISLVLYLRSNLLGLHYFKTDAFISVLDRIIMIGIVGSMLWTNLTNHEMDVMWFAYAQTIGYLVTATVAFFIVVGKTESMKLKWNLPFSIMILKKSFPFAVLVLLMTFYNRIDSVMLERLLPAKEAIFEWKYKELKAAQMTQKTPDAELDRQVKRFEKLSLHNGPDQSGIYAKAYRLLDAVNMIAYLFSVLLLPMFSRMLKYNESIEQLTKLAFTLLATAAVVVGVGCAFYSQELMGMLYNDHIGQASAVFMVLMSCFTAISTSYVFGTLLTANGNLKELNMVAAGGMIINILLNVLLICVFNMEAAGAAISSLITQLLAAVAQVLIVQRKFKFRVNYRLLVTLFVYISGVIATNMVCHTYLMSPGKHGWVLGFVVMTGVSLAWAFAIRLVSIKGIYRIMKYG
ncbi:MAG: membrane protein [Bacteroidetes bacterium]|nr:MAG: membrane protein [Bacteroidota bacterium]